MRSRLPEIGFFLWAGQCTTQEHTKNRNNHKQTNTTTSFAEGLQKGAAEWGLQNKSRGKECK